MPVALATTKRKLHQLLDSISEASGAALSTTYNDKASRSDSTSTRESVSGAKRQRLDKAQALYFDDLGRPSVRLPSEVPVDSWKRHPETMAAEEKQPPTQPHFMPWDRKQFLQRLQTFRHIDKWMTKPSEINEVQWARRGWSCTRRETVRCLGGCEEEIVISMGSSGAREHSVLAKVKGSPNVAAQDIGDVEEVEDDDLEATIQKELVQKYSDMIASAHHENCYWRRKGCDDIIQRLPIIHRAIALEYLEKRYNSLKVMAASLPSPIETPDSIDMAICVKSALDAFTHGISKRPMLIPEAQESSLVPTDRASDPKHSIDPSALALAMFGWQAEEHGHLPGLITCGACFRRLGLWLYKVENGSDRAASIERLDAMAEHRDYCPWVDSISQNGVIDTTSSKNLAGWEVMANHLTSSVTIADGVPTAKSTTSKADSAASVAETATQSSISLGSAFSKEHQADRESKDAERWAKIRRLKQVFQVRRRSKLPNMTGTVRS